jgi:hypothetical protein
VERGSLKLLVLLLLAGCAGSKPDQTPSDTRGDAPAQRLLPVVDAAPPPPPDPLRAQPNLPEDQRLLIVIDGAERIVDRTAAKAAGYTEIDFSDGWTPKIFEERVSIDGAPLANRYRRIFIGLANDETDGDGRPLPEDEKNYLEVFGLPPSMGIIRDRFVRDAKSQCLREVDFGKIGSIPAMTYRNRAKERRHTYTLRRYRRTLKAALKKAKIDDLEQLRLQRSDLAKKITYVMEADHQAAVLAEIEKRLDCDKHNHTRYRHKKGKLDTGLRHAVRRFQRKHKIYEHTNLRKMTMKRLSEPPSKTNYLSFQRVLEERIFAATGILEDGTAEKKSGKPVTYKTADGSIRAVRNLKEEFRKAAESQLLLDTPERALSFFQRWPRVEFSWLRVGIKAPKLPPYYSDSMDLKLVIDRGTVWYDFPYNDKGKKRRQRRKKMPQARLVATYLDQEIPLVRWPTTIGGWRTDQAPNGYVYLKYKGSDVGDRVIRKIISGPTWIPPPSTPFKSLAKRRYVQGKRQGVVNYAEMGPGYLSAYGLVAGYFVIPGRNGRGDHDRGIRAHGSSDYMSIMSAQRFSHGCHRLMNHHAVRMYGFILSHRPHTVGGDQGMNFYRQFLHNDEVYEMRIPSRGFQYNLDPPLPVSVLEGKIEGKTEDPPEGFFKIPGEKYPVLLPGEEAESEAVEAEADKEGVPK